jgi:hypothetical protein
MKLSTSAPITDAEFNAVRALAAEGRPIPAIIMAAIVERLEKQAANSVEPELEESQPQAV